MITINTELEINIHKSEIPSGLLANEEVLYEALVEALSQAFTSLGATEDDVTIAYVDIEGMHDEED
jgi:DNA replication initiation complex subunit (GINS family)